MKHKLRFLVLIMLTFVFAFSFVSKISAATYNQNDIIDDVVFDNANSMNAGQIDNWLNSNFGSASCISTSHGFSAPDPTGYSPSGGFTYGGNVSAGQVISDAAKVYGVNPQVLLTTLEKEQSLVSGGAGCSASRYAKAMGYGCPDSGGSYSYSYGTGGTLLTPLYSINGTPVNTPGGTICVNSAPKVGFSEQVIHAAWLLRFGEQRSEGNINWDVQLTNSPENGDHWNNSDDPQSCYGGPMTQGTFATCPSGSAAFYDGYTTIDGTAVHMDSGATAALYWYTPHFSGNTNFFNIFNSWFGTTYGYYHASYYSESNYPTLKQGQTATVSLLYKNDGTATWYDSAAAPSVEQAPVVLATLQPINRLSGFVSPQWYSANRPSGLFSKVYEADGVTLASNQHIATAGQIVEYDFTVSAPLDTIPATYNEFFGPIREGAANWFMGADDVYEAITVQNAFQASYYSQSPYPTIKQNDQSPADLEFKNTGTATWYDSSSATAAGQAPVVLATDGPINRRSVFGSGWYNTARPAVLFSKVYQADGVTLASNQHTVLPGQIVEYDFPINVPLSVGPGTYREYFSFIREGATSWKVDNSTAYLDVTVQQANIKAAYYSQSPYPVIPHGQSTSIYLKFVNSGDTIWYDNSSVPAGLLPIHLATTGPINRLSMFADSSWPGANRPAVLFSKVYQADGVTLASNQHTVLPGQIVEYDFVLHAGQTPSTSKEYFEPVVEGAPGTKWDTGGVVWLQVTVQ